MKLLWLFQNPSDSLDHPALDPTKMSKTTRGGFKQRQARAKRDEAEEMGPSKLASLLIEQWAWGAMSAPKVQAIAQAAWDDGLHHPDVEKLGKIGGAGSHPGNSHRDLLFLAGQHSLTKAVTTVPLQVKFKKWVSKSEDLDMLLPHKLFALMYEHLPDAFEACVLGGSPDNIPNFWKSMKDNPKLLCRPDLQARPDLHHVVPISLHGDGVSYMQVARAGGKSLEVLSWSSLLCRGPTKVTNFLLFLIVKSVVKDYGVSQTWHKAWRVLSWSLQALATGLWPERDWEGKVFEDKDSPDHINKGKALAGGFSAVVFILRSDLEFLNSHFGLSSASSNHPCVLCQADRQMDSRPWTDCRPTALWRGTVWTREGWAQSHPDAHPFLQMQGSGIDLLFPDLMHCKHLGTDQVLLGSILTWLIKHYLPGSVADNLELVWTYIQTWYKDPD